MTTSAEELETLFPALGDRTRLRLLNLMADGEVCVCFFVEVLGEPQPKISRHLAYLRKTGLVTSRKEGKWVHYGISTPRNETARSVFEAVLTGFANDRELRRDRLLLQKACCSPRMPEQLRRAPRPVLPAR